MEEERFKQITGYEGLYEISNHGRVKSLAKEWRAGYNSTRRKGDTFLVFGEAEGYSRVVLCKVGIKKKYCSVHQLVASHFCDNHNNYPVVNHKNSNKKDNYYENLEWTTYSGNAVHAFSNGRRTGRKGEKHHYAKYSNKEIVAIRKLCADRRYTQREVAAIFSDTQGNISRIVTGKRWSHITSVK